MEGGNGWRGAGGGRAGGSTFEGVRGRLVRDSSRPGAHLPLTLWIFERARPRRHDLGPRLLQDRGGWRERLRAHS